MKYRRNKLKAYDFDSLMEKELSVARDSFLKSIISSFKVYDLDCVVVKKDEKLANTFFTVNGVPMRLIFDTGYRMIFQQYRIIVRALPELALEQNLKTYFPQSYFFNVEDIAEHFKKHDLVNILKTYAKVNGLAKTGVFENIAHGETEDDEDAYMGHFKTTYVKLIEDAHYLYLDKIIETFKKFDVECEYDDEGVPVSGDPVLYFHVAGIPMELRAKSKMRFEMYEKIIKDRPELKLINKNVFYENSDLRSFFSVQECVEYFKKHDLLNAKLNPMARTGIFERVEFEDEFRTIDQELSQTVNQQFSQKIKELFEVQGLKCEIVDTEFTNLTRFLIEGVPMDISGMFPNRSSMGFSAKPELLKYLPSISYIKNYDNLFSRLHTFYAVSDVVHYFKNNDLLNKLRSVNKLNPLAKSGVFERNEVVFAEHDFRTIEANVKKKIEPLFNEEVMKIFKSKGLKCEVVDINAYEPYLLVEGVLMRILNRNRMIFAPYNEMLKHLPSLSLTDLNTMTISHISKTAAKGQSVIGEWHTFYSVDEVVDYFKEHNIVEKLAKVKNLNPLAKSGVFERIKSFKDFEKEQ